MSDIKIVLTTGRAGEYRSRMQTAETCAACDAPTVEELYGHKVILSSHSEFFKAVVDWSDSSCGAELSTGGSNKRGREEPEVAVLSLSDEQQFGTAKLMIRFMYTQQLADSMERSEVIRLMQMADEFSVPSLRHACMARLAATPLRLWSADERQLLCSCWASVDNDMLTEDARLAAAAKHLAAGFASYFTELEAVLADDANWALLCSLPQTVLLDILCNDSLVVRSENTVLVAALSWLRTAGKGAPEAARKEALSHVRLLRLSPWFLSWFVLQVPEARVLLAPGQLSTLVHYMATMQQEARAQLRAGSGWLHSLAAARRGESVDLKVSVELSVDGTAVRRAVSECIADHAAAASWQGSAVFFNGVMWHACARVKAVAGEPKEGGEVFLPVAAGLAASLKIGTESEVHPHGTPFDFCLTCKPVLHKYGCRDASFGIGSRYLVSLVDIERGADQDAALQPLLRSGCLVVQCDVLS